MLAKCLELCTRVVGLSFLLGVKTPGSKAKRSQLLREKLECCRLQHKVQGTRSNFPLNYRGCSRNEGPQKKERKGYCWMCRETAV